MIVVNDTGIYINNGKGAIDRYDGAERDDQQSRSGGDVMPWTEGFRKERHSGQAGDSWRDPESRKLNKPGLPLSRQ